MGFLSSAFFWGGLVILVGLSIILNSFGVRIPLLRIAFGLFLTWLGLSMLVSAFRQTTLRRETVILDTRTVQGADDRNEYNSIFGSAVFDLSGVRTEERDRQVEINAVFGQARVIIDLNMPVRIDGSAAFGQTRFPDHSNISFGERTYTSPAYRENEPALILKASSVFGQLLIGAVTSLPEPDTVPNRSRAADSSPATH